MVPLVAPDVLAALLCTFHDCFTQPSFFYFERFVTVFVMSPVRKVTTNVIRQTPHDERHFSDYHRFLSRARWSVDRVGQTLLNLLLSLFPFERDDQRRLRLYAVMDETFVSKVGKNMAGVAWFFNTHGGACRGTHQLGNQWIVLGLLVSALGQTLCLPLRAGLCHRPKDRPESEYRSPREILCAMIDALSWPKNAILTLIGDAAFASKEMLEYCRKHDYHLISRLPINARVHLRLKPSQAKTRGRPRKYGDRVDLREKASHSRQWRKSVRVYQRRARATFTTFVGILRRSGETARIVLVQITGCEPVALFSTDLSLSAQRIIQLYCDRFQIEMTFRDLKQHHGFGHYQARSQQAIERHAQLALVACSLLRTLTLRQEQWLRQTPLRDLIVGPWNRLVSRLSANQVRQVLYALCILEMIFAILRQRGHLPNKSALANNIKHAGLPNVRN
jgi:SRSO17 transposase